MRGNPFINKIVQRMFIVSELKQEELFNNDHIEQYVKEIGKDQMLIFPGGPPVQGFKGKSES